MANPLFNRFGNNSQMPVQNGPLGNFTGLINRFNQFKSTFQGDPQQTVQELLNSGQMSQQQYEQFSNLAAQLRGLFK